MELLKMHLSAQELAQICAATVPNASLYVEHLNGAMTHFGINSPTRVAMFLAQASFESQRLTHTEENLGYSSRRLMAVWPKRFPTYADAEQCAMDPKALAEKVYGGRMGNRPTGFGDGWRYRGRGLKQLTGYSNYSACDKGLASVNPIPILANPDLVAQPEGAAWSACWFWYANRCNDYADADNYLGLTKVINGGTNGYEDGNDVGLDDRVELLVYAETQISNMPPTMFV